MKFSTSALVASLVGLASAEQTFDLLNQTKTYKSNMGAIIEEHIWDNGSKKSITLPSEKFMADYQQQAEHLNFLTNVVK